MAGKKQQFRGIKNTLENNPFEALGGIAKGVGESVTKDLGKASVDDFFAQLLGDLGGGKSAEKKPQAAKGGELKPGQALQLGKSKAEHAPKPAEAPKKPDIAPSEVALRYRDSILRNGEHMASREKAEVSHQVQEIMAELKRLVASSKILEAEFREVTAQQVPSANTGKYHVNFLDFVLMVVRQARMKVEDSGAWLSAMKSKKGQKGYWNQYKKHGTSFGLSNERTVATQTG